MIRLKLKLQRFLDPINFLDSVYSCIVFLFFLVCLLDPAGRLTGLKIPLFISVLFLGLLIILGDGDRKPLNKNIVLFYFLMGILVPLVSIFNVLIFNWNNLSNFNIVGGIKNYSFLILVIIFSTYKKNTLKLMIIALTILSLVMILMFLVIKLQIKPNIGSELNSFGVKYIIYQFAPGNFMGFEHLRLYFWTSPLLVLAIGYYANKVVYSGRKLKYIILMSINVIGMILSGSRINIVFSVFVAFMIIFFQHITNRRFLWLFAVSLFAVVIISSKIKDVEFERSNSDTTKIEMVKQYVSIYFKDTRNFLIGEGMGAGFYIESRGKYLTYTELTFFEIIRKYGFMLGGVLIFLMLLPLKFYNKVDIKSRWILFVYGSYLIMAFFNPFYFSSSGFLLLIFTLVTIFTKENTILIVD